MKRSFLASLAALVLLAAPSAHAGWYHARAQVSVTVRVGDSVCHSNGYRMTCYEPGYYYGAPYGGALVAPPGAGLFPQSVEQQLGVAPNECFVDQGTSLLQVACSLSRKVVRYIDTPGGRGVVFE